MTASIVLPRPAVYSLKREAQHYALSALPALDGLIAAIPLRLRAKFRRFYAGTLSHSPLHIFHNACGDLANFLHVSVSFVARFHEVKLTEGNRACPTNGMSPATIQVAPET